MEPAGRATAGRARAKGAPWRRWQLRLSDAGSAADGDVFYDHVYDHVYDGNSDRDSDRIGGFWATGHICREQQHAWDNAMKTGGLSSMAAVIAVLCFAVIPSAQAADDWALQRQHMVQQIASDLRHARAPVGQSELLDRVMTAMATVPRHAFVPLAERAHAYDNRPLPIGYGQTISQPYIVGVMTELLHPHADATMLEIGTGSGYQAAVLAQLVKQVYSIEIIPALAEQARTRLAQLNFHNIETRIGDGYYGWPDAAPFDGIVVTAAADHVPPPLVAQLKPGGRLVIPVGDRFTVQQLLLIQKTADGQIRTRHLLPVRFVPLTGAHGQR